MVLFYATLSVKRDDGTTDRKTLKSYGSLQRLFPKFAHAVSKILFGMDITEMKSSDIERKDADEDDEEEVESIVYIRNLLVNGSFEDLKRLLQEHGGKYDINWGIDHER